MNSQGQFTRTEIFSQPDAWRGTLKVVLSQVNALRSFFREGDYQSVIFTGCGSTYYLSLAAASLFQELTGILAHGLPASEIWLYPDSVFVQNERVLLVAISRSGETSETLKACNTFRQREQGNLLTLSCYPASTLSTLGDLNLVLPDGQENSVAQTRAFSSLYLASVALSAIWADRQDIVDELSRLPDAAENLLIQYHDFLKRRAADSRFERFYFLGSGPRYGLACELSLKMKEMSLTHSEPFHVLEFRHGPQSMITPQTLIVGLISESNRSLEMTVLEEMRRGGAHILAIGDRDADVWLNSGTQEAARNVLYLLVGQLLAFERALYRQCDPDHPNNLDAVVRLGEMNSILPLRKA